MSLLNLKEKRARVRNAISGKFPKVASRIEKRIYNMCNRIASEYEREVDGVYDIYAYECVGNILSAPDRIDTILDDIDKDITEWDSNIYDRFREKNSQNNIKMIQGVKVEESEFVCRNKKCRSKKCFMTQSQDRSGDEGMTTYITCIKCGVRYRFN